MSATAEVLAEIGDSAQVPERTLLSGLALTSFASLLLELALTRLFSVVLFYHFAFLAISIALLGLGAGGVFAYLFKAKLNAIDTRRLASRICLTNSMVVLLVLDTVIHSRVALEVSSGNFLRLTWLYLAAAVPFFLTGLLFSVVFARETQRIPRMYGADLGGGSLACLAVVPLLNWLGGPNTILFSGMVLAIAALVWAESKTARRIATLFALAVAALIAANYSGRLIDVVYAKGMYRDPAWVEFARWNALSRVEVDRQGAAKAIVIDADASTYIMNADLSKWSGSVWEHNLMSAPPALANVLRPHGEFAIIGPGGGVDVLRAVANGSPSVTGIEINPIIANTIMRGRYADYSLHLYDRPDVHIHVTDGRSYLRATTQHFDVVQMTLVDTWASTAAGAFALSENNLYTVEAFREYFDHLKPGGMIAITRWEFRQPREALRVVSVAMEALHQMGVANPARNFIVASQGALDEDGIPVVVLAKKIPFTADEESAVAAHLDRYAEVNALYLPSHPGKNAFSDLIARNDPYAFANGYAYNVAPVTDNAPFFFFTLKARQILGERSLRDGIDWKVNLGILVLLLVLVISVFAVVLFLILPLALKTGEVREQIVDSALFHRRGAGLYSGGDSLHPALRSISWTSYLRSNRSHFSHDALQRRGEPALADLASAHQAGLDAAGPGNNHPSRGCIFSAQPVGLFGGIGIWIPIGDQRSHSRSPGLCDGNAISDRPARPGCGAIQVTRGLGFRKFGGMGLGDERGGQCFGVRAGYGGCHSVRPYLDPGLRRGGLLLRFVANCHLAGEYRRLSAVQVCYYAARRLVKPRRRREETFCPVRSSSNGRSCAWDSRWSSPV